MLIGVRPFKVGDRVRLQAGGLAGQVEGVVASLGLLYTTFAQGEDSVMVPNNVVLSAAVVPLREPASVDLRARLRPDVKPSDVQAMLEEAISTPVRGEPTIALEEIDADEVVVRIQATPLADADGPKLADEVLAAVGAATHEETPAPTTRGRPRGLRRNARYEALTPPASRRARGSRRARLALVGLAALELVGGRGGAEPALDRADRPGGELASSVPARRGSGATSSSARLCSIAFTTARATSSGRLVPT